MTPRLRRHAIRLALVALGCWLGAQVGLSLAIGDSPVSPLWPPTGIAIAALLLWGRGMAPAVVLAAFAASLPLTDPRTAGLIAVANSAGPLVAVTALRRLRFTIGLERLRDAVILIVVGAASTAVGATIGTAAVVSHGAAPAGASFTWFVWWTGDTMGALVVTPVVLALVGGRSALPRGWRAVELTVLLSLTAAAAYHGFFSDQGLRFLVYPLIAVTAVRFQLVGAAPAGLLTSLCAVWAATEGAGPFAGVHPTGVLIALGMLHVAITVTVLPLSALMTDRQRAHAALERQSEDLEQLVLERTAELTAALELLDEAQQIARMGSYELDLRTGEGRWSDELYRLMERPAGSGMTLSLYLDLCHPDEAAEVRAVIGHTIETGEPFSLTHRLQLPHGGYRWLSCHGEVVRDEDGTIIGTRGTAADADERKAEEHRFQSLLEAAADAMVFVDAAWRITRVNPRTEQLFGHRAADLVGRSFDVLVRDRSALDAGSPALTHAVELTAAHRDGTTIPVEVSLSPLSTEQGSLVLATIRDVSERRAQQEELTYRGLHDALTGLPNRRLLEDRLATTLAGMRHEPGTTTWVAFCDVDRFKWVNDGLGHEAGDLLLRALAARLRGAVRVEDTVARFGGDEFVVVAREPSGAEPGRLADRLRAAVSEPVTLPGGHVVLPTLSVGLASAVDPLTDTASLLRDADAAMYRAKESGRDRAAVFAPELHAEVSARLATASALRQGVGRDEIVAHFQPVVSLPDLRPVAVEALARWEHPERGLLSPAHFIALAEETGQVGALDRVVILRACRDFATLPGAADLTLNVNVSLRHLDTGLLRETLLEGLEVGRLRPSQLTVEVTESADLESHELDRVLRTVADLGVRIAIDDFGTGFSGLSRLAGLAIDTLKVDRSFVVDVHLSPRSRALVTAMTQLAAALGAGVVAEGVEHESQATVLGALGCTAAQGYLWSRPLPAPDLARWLTAQSLPAKALPAPRTAQSSGRSSSVCSRSGPTPIEAKGAPDISSSALT